MRPRYELAKIKGRDFFNEHIKTIGIDYLKLIKDMGWELLVYNLKGEEGYTFYVPIKNTYQICLDNSGNPTRNKFTLAHEIGHIALSHYIQFDFDTLTGDQYKAFDYEADIFAGEILMPYKYITSWNTDFETMRFRFDVSKSAMQTRLKFLQYKIAI